MKLPLLEHVKSVAIGRSPSPLVSNPFNISWEEAPSERALGKQDLIEYRSSVEVFYVQHKPSTVDGLVREHAIRAIAHEVYGPVAYELRGLLNDLRAIGLPPNASAFKRVEAMIDALEASDV